MVKSWISIVTCRYISLKLLKIVNLLVNLTSVKTVQGVSNFGVTLNAFVRTDGLIRELSVKQVNFYQYKYIFYQYII